MSRVSLGDALYDIPTEKNSAKMNNAESDFNVEKGDNFVFSFYYLIFNIAGRAWR